MDPQLRRYVARRRGTIASIKQILIENLHLQLEPAAIDPDAPLFGSGLGLDSVDALAEQVDGLLLLSDDGGMHLDRVKRVVDKGLPVFCDKPLEGSTATARELVDLCREHNCPLFSGSSLRFSVELQALETDAGAGPVLSEDRCWCRKENGCCDGQDDISCSHVYLRVLPPRRLVQS